jgi:hypothetical protein
MTGFLEIDQVSLLQRTHAMIMPPLPYIQNLDIDKTARGVKKCSKLEQASREDLSVLNT